MNKNIKLKKQTEDEISEFPQSKLPNPILSEHPEWVELYWNTLKIGWNNIVKDDRVPPHMTCLPDLPIIWQWDSCFMALYSRFLNSVLPAMNNLDIMYHYQREDGFIAMAYNFEKGQEAYGENINPPLYAWTEWELFLASGDKSRLLKILPVLVNYFDWLKKNRTRKSGLYWFEVPESSGMDNSPRGSYYNKQGSGICHLDLTCQQALSALYLAKIAKAIGENETAARFQKEHGELKNLVNKYMWNEKTHFYYDVFDDHEVYLHYNWLNHKTICGFWPMLAGISSEMQTKQLIDHLLNPDEFYRPHRIPSLSADDPNYDPQGGYWLGGVWPPTNYMVVKGLEYANQNDRGFDSASFYDLAFDFAANHLDNMVKTYKECTPHTVWECYSPEYVRPGTSKWGQISRPDIVGWSGLGPIAMLIEHIIGIHIYVPENAVFWNIKLFEEHGLENLSFGNGTISLLSKKRSASSHALIVKSDVPFTLNVSLQDKYWKKFTVKKGENIFSMTDKEL